MPDISSWKVTVIKLLSPHRHEQNIPLKYTAVCFKDSGDTGKLCPTVKQTWRMESPAAE